MIDRHTGEISLVQGCSIGATLEKSGFASSPAFGASRPLVVNPPFASFALPLQNFGGRSYSVSLWFEAEALRSVQLADAGDEFGVTWSDWSEEKEAQRKKAHDRVLAAQLGSAWSRGFSWGTVESLFERKSGSSVIVVTYKQRKPLPETTRELGPT